MNSDSLSIHKYVTSNHSCLLYYKVEQMLDSLSSTGRNLSSIEALNVKEVVPESNVKKSVCKQCYIFYYYYL